MTAGKTGVMPVIVTLPVRDRQRAFTTELIRTAKERWKAMPLFCVIGNMSKTNPRHQNGNLRRKHRARLKAMGCPCHICGRPIHYDEPSDAQHPWSFVIDEVIPVSRWREFGYASPEAAAQDWNNLAPAHYICNAKKSNKIDVEPRQIVKKINIIDGEW